ncbi:MAG: hypothetical protein WCH59_09150 [Chitinophagia bacterium]
MKKKLRKAKVRPAKKSKNPFVIAIKKAQARTLDSIEKSILQLNSINNH